ncbi:MAG: hypothetical protein WCG21_01625 [Eubacteriales bacterium]
MDVFSWIQENKEWLFSGALIAIPLAVIGWIMSRKNISKVQKSGHNSTNIQADRDVMITMNEVQRNESNDPKSRR